MSLRRIGEVKDRNKVVYIWGPS
jgi:hypothetical protein